MYDGEVCGDLFTMSVMQEQEDTVSCTRGSQGWTRGNMLSVREWLIPGIVCQKK